MMPKNRKLCLAMAIATCLSTACLAGGDDARNVPQTEMQVFDIRSLLLEVPDYRATFSDLRSDDLYGPPTPRQSQNLFRGPEQKEGVPPLVNRQRENAEIVLEMVQSVVDPDSWVDRGGEVGSARFYAGQLVVTQTAENLASIKHLLDLLQAARSSTVRIEAFFVRVPSAGPERWRLEDLISKKQFTNGEFRELLEAAKDVITVTRASLCGFDGQRVFTTSGQQINIVVGANAVVAQGSSATEPVVRQLMGGVTLEGQPVIDHERNTVLLDLRASMAEVEADVRQMDAPDSPLATGMAAPPYRVAHFATSLSLPMNTVYLVSAAPYDEEHDVLLFVRPTVD